MRKLHQDIKEGHAARGIASFFRRHLGVIAYSILAVTVAFSFYLYDQDRKHRRGDILQAISINCNRLNQISDQNAADIYEGWNNLERNAKLLDVPLTPELKHQVLVDSNHNLKNLKFYDCSIPPDQPQKFLPYKKISLGKPTPTVPDRDTTDRGAK